MLPGSRSLLVVMTFTPSTVPLLFGYDSVGLVDTASMVNIYDRDRPRLLVNPVEDPVIAPAALYRSSNGASRRRPTR
jgi:hypothetical protein